MGLRRISLGYDVKAGRIVLFSIFMSLLYYVPFYNPRADNKAAYKRDSSNNLFNVYYINHYSLLQLFQFLREIAFKINRSAPNPKLQHYLAYQTRGY